MKLSLRHITRALRQDRRSRWAARILIVFAFLAVFGDFIANDKPLYCKYNGKTYFPVLRAIPVNLGLANWPKDLPGDSWSDKEFERVVYTLIPYRAATLDLKNTFVKPFSRQDVRSPWFRHWLGTDNLGRDTLAGLIRGCRISLLVGLFSMFLAALIGIPLGAVSGYFGDRRQKADVHKVVVVVVVVVLAVLYLSFGASHLLNGGALLTGLGYLAAILVVCAAARALLWLAARRGLRTRRVFVNWDFIILRSIEILRSVPAFFLLFAVLGIVEEPSLVYVVLLIAVLRSPTIIRYVRAEALKLRDQTFVDAARVIGLRDRQIIARHIIPNALGPVLITMAFGMGTAVLLESGLSFLGIGSGLEEITWGKMLNTARTSFGAWWMAIFPGVAIFVMIACFNRIGDVLTGALQRTKVSA